MATEVNLNTGDPLSPNDQLTYTQVMALQTNMFAKMFILVDGKVKALDPAVDTKTISFTKSKIDDLFAANPGSDGLRIYVGLMDMTVVPNADPLYQNKLMVSLVTTTGTTANLDKDLTTDNLSEVKSGTAMDFGVICPPYTTC